MTTGARQAARADRSVPGATLKAGVRYDEQAKVYIGYAPSLNIYSQAPTQEHARRALEGAITLFLKVVSRGRRFSGVLPTSGASKYSRRNGAARHDDHAQAEEEEMLAQRHFHWIFDVPTSFPWGGKTA